MTYAFSVSQNRVVCNLLNTSLKDFYFHFGDDRDKVSELVCLPACVCGFAFIFTVFFLNLVLMMMTTFVIYAIAAAATVDAAGADVRGGTTAAARG